MVGSNDNETLEERVTRLEEIHTHQQHLIDQLNEVVVGLRLDLTRLEKRYDEQQSRLKTLMADHSVIEDDPNERPPHY